MDYPGQSCWECYYGDSYVDGNGKPIYVICRWGPPTVICYVVMMGDVQPSPSVWKQWNLFPKMETDDFCHQYKYGGEDKMEPIEDNS